LITGGYEKAGMALAIFAEKIALISWHWHDGV
jgi:hypothetical protein